jgi:hypothetical protein
VNGGSVEQDLASPAGEKIVWPFARQFARYFRHPIMGSLKKRRKAKINKHKRRKKLRLNRHKKRTWQK